MFGADSVAGARLAATGRFLEQLGNDLIRSATRYWHATAGERQEDAQPDRAPSEEYPNSRSRWSQRAVPPPPVPPGHDTAPARP
ncbi:hypothetical protein MOV08_38355 [Streptomyces yunnanensis]|uniref:Uncharacterized protein n=1 Tax=Streptomyces yunnanensis TaxID=156453 RepID=A0ABY8AHV1_9ACTN|nr:hypothetical protein [Streptomyces yunnanensis]WEB44572.1 hypothetical protein MOV08_38355 [Streptomyces yunnanensis]